MCRDLYRRVVVLAALLCAAPVARARAQHPSCGACAAEAVILEVRIGDVASTTVRARRIGDDVLLPIGAILALAQMAPPLPPDNTDGFVSLDSVRTLLHEHVVVDWAEAAVHVSDSHSLPVSRHAMRAVARAKLTEYRAAQGALTRLRAPLAPMTPSLDYVVESSSDPAHDATLSLHAASALLGGALELDWRVQRGSPGAHGSPSATWMRPLGGTNAATYLRLGDMFGTPLVGPLHDAVALSNAPIVRDPELSEITLRGVTTPRADVDALVNGSLVAWTTADSLGRYALRVPLMYGDNHVAIVGDDDNGTVRAIGERRIVIGNDFRPRGTLTYTLAHGRCATASCTRASIADVRIAPTDRAVVAVTAALRDSIARMLAASVSASARVSDFVTLSLDARSHGAAALGVTAGASPGTLASATVRWQPHLLTPDARVVSRVEGAGSLDWRPRDGAAFALRSAIAYGAHAIGSVRGRVALSYAREVARAEPFVRFRARDSHATSRATLMSPGINVGLLGVRAPFPSMLHATIDRDARTVTTSLGAIAGVTVSATTAWTRGTRRPTMYLSLSRQTTLGRYAATITKRDGGATVRQSVDGSVTADLANAQFVLDARSGYGSVRGRVYVDANGNHMFDVGERTLSGVEIAVGDARTETDADGAYVMRGLPPHVPLTVRVTSLPWNDALAAAPMRITLVPNGTATLDIAIAAQ